MPPSSKSPWKHRPQISLRVLFVLLTAFSAMIAWFAHFTHQRWAAFAAIQKAGGDVRMRIGEPGQLEKWFGAELFGTVINVDLRKGKADNALLAQVAALKELRELDLSNAGIDDEGLRLIVHLPLRELWLQETNITDASAATLSKMVSLDFLQLNATSVSDSFLARLAPLPTLENLGLRGTRVTGAGMKYLSRHPKLKTLDVYSTAVDDSGVAHLAACQSLVDLGLSMTKVSNAVFQHLDNLPNLTNVDLNANAPPVTTQAVLEFEKSHPKCNIEWYRK